MRYGFILGRVYTLSVAELIAVLQQPDHAAGLTGPDASVGASKPARLPAPEAAGYGGQVKIVGASPEIMIIETEKPLQVDKLQKKLGGVIKILQIVDSVQKREQDSVNFALKHYFKPSVIKKQFFKDYKGKIQFGVSVYLLDMDLTKRPEQKNNGNHNDNYNNIFSEPKRLGMMIKNSLTDMGESVRLVLPEFNSLALASVVVTKNLLLQKGAEISAIAGKHIIYTARTVSVQDLRITAGAITSGRRATKNRV